MLKFLSSMLCTSRIHPFFTWELLENFTYHWELKLKLELKFGGQRLYNWDPYTCINRRDLVPLKFGLLFKFKSALRVAIIKL